MKKLNRKNADLSATIASPIWERGICYKHTSKMESMISINSSCQCNDFCKKMSKIAGTICAECYANEQMNHYKLMQPKYAEATRDLTTSIMHWDRLPMFAESQEVVRIEAFGELNNAIQAINYINIIRKNPEINFGWWTKRPNLIARALKQLGISIPENVNVVYSNPYIDTMPKLQPYSFIKGYFTVWSTAEKALEHGCIINCGGKKCKNCLECYDYHEEIFFINELKK